MTFIRRTIIALLTFFAITTQAEALRADALAAIGDWHGQLSVPGVSLRIVVHLEASKDGYSGSLDSPDQGATGIPIEQVKFEGETLSFVVPTVQGRYEGRWKEHRWVGQWMQGSALPLTLQPISEPLSASPAPKPGKDGIEQTIETLIGGRPGVVAAVAAIGPDGTDIVRSTSLEPGQRFELGSLTKSFTGLLLADMVLDGKVALDDPVARFLPEGALPAALRLVTLRQLAQHRSGLPRLPANLAVTLDDPYAAYDENRLLTYLSDATPDSKPGERFAYSNVGAGLLGYALGQADGRGYLEALRARVIAPLGMNDTDCTIDSRSVQGFNAEGKKARPWMFDVLAPAGCLRSTIEDMARFAAAVVDPKSAIAQQLVLMRREVANGDNGWLSGLGIFRIPAGQRHFWFHNGGTGGFRSSLFFDPDRRQALVLLTNAFAPNPDPAVLRLIARSAAAKSDKK